MQPAQLSLLSAQTPAPPTRLLTGLPEPQIAAVVAELARLIAAAAATTTNGEVDDD